mgnify:FL=1
MPNIISTTTLKNIAQHSNDAIRLSQFTAETDFPILISALEDVDSDSSALEVIEALDKDLMLTANKLGAIASLVESLDGHVCPELDAHEQDFRVLFPKHYDATKNELNLFGFKINKSLNISGLTNVQRKQMIFESLFGKKEGFAFDDFRSFYRDMRNRKPVDDSAPFDQIMSEAISDSMERKWARFINTAVKLSENYQSFVSSLDAPSRQIMGTRISSSTRAMLYGVAKTSTYVTKKDGVEQWSSKHKKGVTAGVTDKEVLRRIEKLVKEIPYVKAAEIDADTSLAKFHDMLVELKGMDFDVADAFELKVRKLGNYRYSGVYATKTSAGDFNMMFESGFSDPSLKLVVVDGKSPGTLAHELTHFRDRGQEPLREKVISHFGRKMDLSTAGQHLSKEKRQYYRSDKEVLARLGEIGFILNRYEYKDGESLEAFVARVESTPPVVMPEQIAYDVSMSKPISHYVADGNPFNHEIYCKFSTWSPTELSILRDYCQSYFYHPDQRVRERLEARVNGGELDYQSRMYHLKNRKTRKLRPASEYEMVGAQFGRIAAGKMLSAVYLSGVDKGVFQDGEFFLHLTEHFQRIGRKGGQSPSVKLTEEIIDKQLTALKGVVESIDPVKRPGDMLVARQFAAHLQKSLTHNEFIPEHITRVNELSRNIAASCASYAGDKSYDVRARWVSLDGVRHFRWDTAGGRKIAQRHADMATSIAQFADEASQVSISPESMSEANATAQHLWLAEMLTDELAGPSESNAYQKCKADISAHGLNAFLTSEEDALVTLISGMKKLGFDTLASVPNIAASFRDIEIDIAKALLEPAVASTFSVTDEKLSDIAQKIMNTTSEPVLNYSEDYVWDDSPLIAEDGRGRFFEVLDRLNKHPARCAGDGLKPSYLRTYSVGINEYISEDDTIPPALSPLSVAINALKSCSGEEWPLLRRNLSETLYKVSEVFGGEAIQSHLSVRTSAVINGVKNQLEGSIRTSLADSSQQGKMLDVMMASKPEIKAFMDLIVDNAEDEKPSAILMSAARRELAEYWMGMGESLTPSKYSLVAYGPKKDSVMVPLGESALSVREKSFSSMVLNLHQAMNEMVPEGVNIPRSNNQGAVKDEQLHDVLSKVYTVSPSLAESFVGGLATLVNYDQVSGKQTNAELWGDVKNAIGRVLVDVVAHERLGNPKDYLSQMVEIKEPDISISQQVTESSELSAEMDKLMNEKPELSVEMDKIITEQPELKPDDPVKENPELEKIKQVDRVDFEKINKDVPTADGKHLEARHQMKMF